ncbi:restriction endonuclease subunit S [Pseudoclavibacter sp. CFCC 13611]|uniref:restriction endonuclease subunit S n=1 Tax=Pseudoclavibacter sp. CFCC 13611 TaxID=2615178 RepID=UPI001787F850|nr:restriction endonuclease subunit S [Pseudoclavibacter sp. CFCC 13611]
MEVLAAPRLVGRSLERVDVDIHEHQNEVRRGDLLFNGSSETPEEVALGTVVDFEIPRGVFLNSFCFGYRLARGNAVADPTYLAYFFRSGAGRELVFGLAQGATRYNISKRRLLEAPIDLPPLAEQRGVVRALTDIDDLLQRLERVIAKKRAIKQGMMQELLTGRTRLPGFSNEWQQVRLADVASVDPESLSPATTGPTQVIDYISLEEVQKGEILGSTSYCFADAPSRARRRLREDDVLFGTVRPNLQSHARYTGGLRFPVASTGFAVIRSCVGTTDSSFLAQWVLGTDVIAQVDRIIAGSNYPAVSSQDVRNFELLLPSAKEQAAIAGVLTDADAEIDALERRLDATRAIKQGMMQELLTGRTRLPVKEDAA